MNIIEKSWFYSKFLKISILLKILENLDFGQYFRNITILFKILENPDFSENFTQSRYWSKFSKNLDFGQDFWKSQFWSMFIKKISILLKILQINYKNRWNLSKHINFGHKLRTISISVKVFENLDFGQD